MNHQQPLAICFSLLIFKSLRNETWEYGSSWAQTNPPFYHHKQNISKLSQRQKGRA